MLLKNRSLRTLVLIWLAWTIIILGYQTFVDARIPPQRPDYSREWTPNYTGRASLRDRLYLNEPFMNRQVAWDSEYYLSIAVAGYADTNVPSIIFRNGQVLSLNYAFFPLYPLLAGALAVPLSVLGMNPIATATLAGALISLVSTLVAMVSLYLLARDELQDAGGIRAAFYLLIFPTGFFLAQVYTEALFMALALTSLVMIKHKRFLVAGILAGLATWTRAVGLALVVPLALAWLATVDWRNARANWRMAVQPFGAFLAAAVATLLPIGAYLLWRLALGAEFDLVEDNYFGRYLFGFSSAIGGWEQAFKAIAEGSNLQMRVYYLLELGAVLLALVACLATLRRYPGIALFGLLALAVSFFSGAPQSLIRYMLVIPSLYLFLGRLGNNAAFDRAWTLMSVLLLGLLTFLFTYDMWVA